MQTAQQEFQGTRLSPAEIHAGVQHGLIPADSNSGLNAYLDDAHGRSAEERAAAFDERVENLKRSILAETQSALALQDELTNTEGFFECVADLVVASNANMPISVRQHLSRLRSYFDQAALDQAVLSLANKS